MIVGNEDRSADSKVAPVEVNGRLYWPSYYVGRMHVETDGGRRVIRWVKSPGKYVSMYI